MKTRVLFAVLLAAVTAVQAETYTIVFKDGGTDSDKTSAIDKQTSPEIFISSGEDLVAQVSALKCYNAKLGYGLKFGTTSDTGRITLRMVDEYKPEKIIVTAASMESTKRYFKLNNTEQEFTGGTDLTDYEFTYDGETAVKYITIQAARVKSNNRFYVSKIVIVAPDPAPDRGVIKGPKQTDWGFEHLRDGVAATSMEYDITTRNMSSDIALSLKDGSAFSLVSNSLPQDGGAVQLSFSHTAVGTYSDTLILRGTSIQSEIVETRVAMSIRVLGEIYHSGEIDDPYTVADALNKTDELDANETSLQAWYIRGYVDSETIEQSSSHGGLTFNLSWDDKTIYVYSMMGANGAQLPPSAINKGDTLLIHGRLHNYASWPANKREIYLGELVNSEIPVIDWRNIQEGYYDSINGLSDTILKRVLGETVSGGLRYTYGSGSGHTWDGFYYTDRDENGMQVLDMYSNNLRYFSAQDPTASVSGCDIEHMFPKSWWGGDVNDAYKDLYHLVPADYSANRSKGNDAPGIVVTASFDNGSFLIGEPSAECHAPRVFEPANEYKGDFARAYFYILTAYADLSWDMSTPAQYALDPESKLLLQPWLQQLLLDWHRQDPVSDKELKRITQVSRIQHNRNPFIDYPCLVEYIWGTKQGEAVDMSNLLLTSTKEYQTTTDKSGCTCECLPDTTGNDSTTQTESVALGRIYVIDNTVVGMPADGRLWSVTGIDMTLYNGSLPEGMYIVTSNAGSSKVIVR